MDSWRLTCPWHTRAHVSPPPRRDAHLDLVEHLVLVRARVKVGAAAQKAEKRLEQRVEPGALGRGDLLSEVEEDGVEALVLGGRL